MHRMPRSFRAACSTTATVSVFLCLDGVFSAICEKNTSSKHDNRNESPVDDSKRRQYTEEEVAERNGRDHPEMWVSYRGSVYDVTKYVPEHPGGSTLLRQAAGGPLEPFWGYWAYHTKFDRAPDMLQKFRIGQLSTRNEDDEEVLDGEAVDVRTIEDDLYSSDPPRDRSVADGQIMLLERPWCSETSSRELGTFLTSNRAFYVRNHAPVPALEEDGFSIAVDAEEAFGVEGKKIFLDLFSLQEQFDRVKIHAVMQCAGNRAGEMIETAPTAFSGTPFDSIGPGMIGNAAWSGVRLRDVLLHLYPTLENLHRDDLESYHVEFEGADGYVTSSPLSLIIDKFSDAILAFEMNGEPLPPDHGFPVRVVLPGIAGARNVKWLVSIRLRAYECDSCWQTTYYKDPNGKSIQQMPMQCFLLSKEEVKPGRIKVVGVAYGGGSGKGVRRVEVSTDGGETWFDAERCLHGRSDDNNSRDWSWTHFEAEFGYTRNKGSSSLPVVLCRAIDGDGKPQPNKPWYPKGYLYNGWHQI